MTNQTFTYTGNDWLTSDAYDSNGNTRTNGVNTYTYDAENRLTNSTTTGTNITMLYNGDGLRVAKTIGTNTTLYLLDDRNPTGYAQVLEEKTVSGGATNLTKIFTYGLDLISQRQVASSTTHYYGHDGNGNVRYLTATNGTISDTYTYEAFGTVIATTGTTPNDYRYSGEQYDPNLGFTYLRARYLNPNTGRFLTRDSYAGNVFDPPSLHRYTYARNDCVNRVDPSGNTDFIQILKVTAIIGVLVALVVVTTKYSKYRGKINSLSVKEVEAEIVRMGPVIEALGEIADDGKITFKSKNLVVGGRMGVELPETSPGQNMRNLFENAFNSAGWDSALSEFGGRVHGAQGTGDYFVVDFDAIDDEQRAVVAGEVKDRQNAYLKWLKERLEEAKSRETK